MPGVAFPPVGPLGLGSPPSPVLCAAKTTPCPSRVASLVARFPIPCLLHGVRVVPRGLVAWWTPPGHARAFGRPVPRSGHGARRQVVLPSSRVTPLKTCPALRPRWCPAHSPLSHTGLLPSGACKPSAFPSIPLRLSYGPRLYTFRGSSTRPTSSLTPASYSHCWAGTWSALLTCWRGLRQVGLAPPGSHPLGNNNPCHGVISTPKVSGLPWREQALVRPGLGY